MSDLGEACAAWQSDRDGGSSPLRGAARVLTGIPHYFAAGFITKHEDNARNDKSGIALARAEALLRAVRESERLTAEQWRDCYSLAPGDFAGRGIGSKDEDPQITAALQRGVITMPLWGVSLDRAVADSYGTRFRFVLKGPFRGVAAWAHSGIKDAQHEIIAGGTYRVVDMVDETIKCDEKEFVTSTTATISEIRPVDAVRITVEGLLPPKKDGAASMWNKPSSRPLIVALRTAAAKSLNDHGPFDEPVVLELIIRTPTAGSVLHERRARGDLDNFITGISDGLQAAHHGSTSDEDWPELPPRAKPSQALALTDDSWIVKISSSFAEGPVGYDVVIRATP